MKLKKKQFKYVQSNTFSEALRLNKKLKTKGKKKGMMFDTDNLTKLKLYPKR